MVDLDVVAYQSRDLNQALDVPLRIARLCVEAAKLCSPLIRKGNVNLISDVAVAAILFESAFASACFNVEINLKYLGDKKLSRALKKELTSKTKVIKRTRLQTEEKVGAIIRG